MLWPDILTTALLGTDRQQLTSTTAASSDELNKLLAQLNPQERESQLLSAAALHTIYQQAGQRPEKSSIEIPIPAEPDSQSVCSPLAAQHLATILNNYPTLLLEWLTNLARVDRRIPEASLTSLLTFKNTTGTDDTKEIRAAIFKVIGKRGRWLAAQNSQWQYANVELVAPQNIDEVWQTGNKPTREALLRELRQSDPVRARELVASTWKEDNAEERTTFIEALKIGLSMADEPFLEAALDDKSKNVRRAIATLLATLPESPFYQRMLQRITPLVNIKTEKKKTVIDITLPTDFTKDMLRDGMEKDPPYSSFGEKAWWVKQMMTFIKPSYWSDTWQISPQDLWALINKSEWKNVFTMAISEAALAHKDISWAMALLELGIVNSQLLAILPDDKADALLIKWLEAETLIFESPTCDYLIAYQRCWSVPMAQAFLKRLKNDINTSKAGKYWNLQYSLANFARYIPITLIDEVQNGWPKDASEWNRWEHYIDAFIKQFQFRYDMLKEIN